MIEVIRLRGLTAFIVWTAMSVGLSGTAANAGQNGKAAKADGIAQQVQQVGEVAELKGDALASSGGRDRALASRDDIFIGDVVSTRAASRLLLRLGERTTIRLGENSRVRIVSYLVNAGGELDFTAGAIEFERSGPRSRMPWLLRSVYGLIAVRGTRFFAGPSRGKFAVFVLRGELDVTGTERTTVRLEAGQGTDISAPGSSPTKPKVWGQARIDEAFTSVR